MSSAMRRHSRPRAASTRDFDSVHLLLEDWRRERPDLDASPIGVQGRIQRLAAHLLRGSEVWLQPLGLSWEAFSLILTLRRSGKPFKMRPTDIVRKSLISSGAVTNRIDRVEKLGLIQRKPDPNDRRGYIISLTPAGKKLADKAIANHCAGMKELLAVLQPSERDQLSLLLSKLLASFEEKTKPAP